ncbi:hypothetical protein KP509_27G014100 [Ceratopteris richardii]|nr:hypothetical protein KP509_27G014100 [Ceratopteris richardii]
MARRAIRAAPPLVPIYSHCYIPCSPKLSGNPILFIFEKDVFYCGYDLADFFGREIFLPAEFPLSSLDMQSTVNWSPKRMRSRISAQLEDNGCSTGGREINDGGCHGLTPGERVNFSRSTHAGSRLNQNIYGDPQGHRLRQKNSNEHGHNRDERHLCHADVDAKHDRAVCSESLAPNNGDAFGQCVDQVSCERLAKWDALNRRLLAELESTDKKDYSLAAPRSSLCEEPLHCRESLPRDAARSAGSSPRTSQRIVSRYAYFHQGHLPAKLLSQLTIAAPPWAAKMARYIPMWSDLVESNASEMDNAHVPDVVQLQNPAETLSKNASRRNIQAKEKRRSSNGAGSSTRTHESTNRVLGSGNGSDLDKGHSKESDSALPTLLATQENQVGKMGQSNHVCLRLKGEDEGMFAFNKRCLLPYFKDLERRLRNGGWKQVEIEEMIAASLPDDECFSLVETRQGIHNALSRDADLKSMSLRKAGWSRPDVVEILS